MDFPPVSIAILTVIPPELKAAKKALKVQEKSLIKHKGTNYWFGTIHSHPMKRKYNFVLSCIGTAGNYDCAAAVSDVIYTYNPGIILLMGIAAGIRNKIKIGEVVLSERVVAYEYAALEAGGVEIPRPESNRVNQSINQDITNYLSGLDENRLEHIFRTRLKGRHPTPPSSGLAEWQEEIAEKLGVKATTIASGEKLLRDPDKLRVLRETRHGKIDTGEMEAAGLANVCQRHSKSWLVVRAISDFGDAQKTNNYHDYASNAAATVLVDFINKGLMLPEDPDPDKTSKIGPQTRSLTKQDSKLLENLKKTLAWKRLQANPEDDRNSCITSQQVISVINFCEDSYRINKNLQPAFMNGSEHPLRILYLAEKIYPHLLDFFNRTELAIFILSAFIHDVTLFHSEEEETKIEKTEDFQQFQAHWERAHPNLRQIMLQLSDPKLPINERQIAQTKARELQGALWLSYLTSPTGHTLRTDSLKLWLQTRKIPGNDIFNLVLSTVHVVCQGMLSPASEISPAKGFLLDRIIGENKVNIPSIVFALRLLNLMTFSIEMTGDILFKNILLSWDVSILAWEEHKRRTAWNLDNGTLSLVLQSEHPTYEATARQFLEQIQSELINGNSFEKLLPSEFEKYKANLPLRIDTSHIQARDNSYIYHKLEFSLSRDEIVQLFMTDKLYKSPALCVRELVQNSLDALRYKKALCQSQGFPWNEGKVRMKHFVNEQGYEVLECTDNGVGMDEDIIRNFLTAAGRSYYRSPDFEQERIRFRRFGTDFDPCAQFGIGFLSCFMLGDQVSIRTRRFLGVGRELSRALDVQINGLSGMLVIRDAPSDTESGTTVQIVSRTKIGFVDARNDKIRLIGTLKAYATACEFPIYAECVVPGIEKDCQIPSGIADATTHFEYYQFPANSFFTLEQNFEEIHPGLRGKIRESFLRDEQGIPCIANKSASWEDNMQGQTGIRLLEQSGQPWVWLRGMEPSGGQTCIDGIVICGNFGKPLIHEERFFLPGVYRYYSQFAEGLNNFVVDIRGNIKPTLTPARTPPEKNHDNRKDQSWAKIEKLIHIAYGRLWSRLIKTMPTKELASRYWQIACLYGPRLSWVPADIVWDYLHFPLIKEMANESDCRWLKLSEIEELMIEERKDSNNERFVILKTIDEQILRLPSNFSMGKFSDGRHETLVDVVAAFSLLTMRDSIFLLKPVPPQCGELTARRRSQFGLKIPYDPDTILGRAFAVFLPLRTVNSSHPVIISVTEGKEGVMETPLQEFLSNFVQVCSGNDFLSIFKALEAGSSKESVDIVWYDRVRRWLGYLFEQVDWSNAPSDLAPPYSLWLPDKGMITFDLEQIKNWAKLPTHPALKQMYGDGFE